MDKCEFCIMLKEANKLKVPVITMPISIDEDPIWCRKCYQDERAKFEGLKKAYAYRLYIDACHAMKRKAISYIDWLNWANR